MGRGSQFHAPPGSYVISNASKREAVSKHRVDVVTAQSARM